MKWDIRGKSNVVNFGYVHFYMWQQSLCFKFGQRKRSHTHFSYNITQNSIWPLSEIPEWQYSGYNNVGPTPRQRTPGNYLLLGIKGVSLFQGWACYWLTLQCRVKLCIHKQQNSTEQVPFIYIFVYTYMCTCALCITSIIKEKEAIYLRRNRGEVCDTN